MIRRRNNRRHYPKWFPAASDQSKFRAALALAATVVLSLSGCGLLDRREQREETRVVTRGQQPLVASPADPHDGEPAQLMRSARRQYKQGQLQQARLDVRAALEAEPRLMTALELEARIALDLADVEGYHAALLEMLAAQPDSATVQNAVGKRLVESGRWQEGVHALSRAIELEPRNDVFARDLAAACLEPADREIARQALEQALRGNPHDAALPVALARLHESAENWGEAARYFEAAIEADSHNLSRRPRQAHCLYRAEDYPGALAAYADCVARDASSVSLAEYAELGDAALRTGDLEQAQAAYDHVSRESTVPSREVELLRIVCAIRRDDLPRARTILRKALDLWSQDEELLGLTEVVDLSAKGL